MEKIACDVDEGLWSNRNQSKNVISFFTVNVEVFFWTVFAEVYTAFVCVFFFRFVVVLSEVVHN